MESPLNPPLPDPAPLAGLFEVAGAAGVSRVPVRGATVRIGRAVDNDIVLSNEPTVSRHHAELLYDDGSWSVRDLGSHNGSLVNGERVGDTPTTFGPDDIVGLGNVSVRLMSDVESDALTIEDPSAIAAHQLLTALSKREREVLAEVASGHTDDEVAAALFISVKTVHSHLDRIRDKTGLRRRAELTRLAVRLGLGPR